MSAARALSHAVLALAAACCGRAHAQTASPSSTSAVPPPLTAQQLEDKRKEANTSMVWQGATAMPGAILDGGKILIQRTDPGSFESFNKAAGAGANVVWGAAATGKVLEGYSKGGVGGALTEGAQQATEKGVELLVAHGAELIGGEAAGGPVGLTWTASTMFGTYLRDNPSVGQSMGLRGSIGDSLNDWYVDHSPNGLKEWMTGVKQVDIDDPAVMQQMMDQATRNRHQQAFDAVQQDNARQQAQVDAALAQQAAVTAVSSTPAPDPNDGAAAVQAMLQAMGNPAGAARVGVTAAPRSEPAAVPGHVCKLDPKTGCHPGHDEASHPGGCKKC